MFLTRHPSIHCLGIIILAACFAPLSGFGAQPKVSPANPEAAFQAALQYTLKIRTIVEIPFADDAKGVFEGAGFLVDQDRRWIMTNAHVVSRSPSRITSAFKGGRFLTLKKVYVDPFLDVAIVEITDGPLPDKVSAASLECDNTPAVGHLVGAFGHPWALSYTGTRGIVSGSTTQQGIEWLQTDTSLNSGNSGGPLISLITGQVVGINTAMLNIQNIDNPSFAVPMPYACRILALLQKNKNPSPPQLPILFFDYEEESRPLKVAAVYLDGIQGYPALQEGDIIESVTDDGTVINNETQFIHALRGRLEQVSLNVLRNGESLTLSGRFDPVTPITERQGLYVSGLFIAPSRFRDEPEANLGKMLVVHFVEEGSLASAQGFQIWDFIKSVDGRVFRDLRTLATYLENSTHSAQIVIKRFSEANDRIYEYREFELPVENIKFIGDR